MSSNQPIRILRNQISIIIVIFCTFLSHQNSIAQSLDPNFTSPLPLRACEIYSLIEQRDGKVLLAGDINFYKNKNVGNVIRLKSDGSLDNSFEVDLPSGFIPYHMELMSSGEILVFDYSKLIKLGINGKTKKILELQGISAVTPLADNKFLISTWSGGLFRYKTNFTLDSTFPNQNNFADAVISDMAVQGNEYIISGYFSFVNGVNKNDVARLHPDGSVDVSFNTGAGTNDFIGSLTLQPDGKILFGHTYINSFDGHELLGGMARLNSNGSYDSLFSGPHLNGPVSNVFVSNDKILVSTSNRIIKLNLDGSADNTFVEIHDGSFSVPYFTALSDNSLIAVNLKTIGGDYGVAKFSPYGNLISSFKPSASRLGIITSMDKDHNKLIVGGDFFKINNHFSYNSARLFKNGSVDKTFKSTKNDGAAFKIDALPDGNVLVSSTDDFVKLTSTGQLDSTFQFSPFKTLSQVLNFITLSEGKIIAGGYENPYRLNADGSEDSSFNIGSGICCFGSTLSDFDIQSSEKIIYGSLFNQFNNVPANKMVRLNLEGSVDSTFTIGSGPSPDAPIYLIEILKSDEVLVAGYFNQFDNHSAAYNLLKLRANGAVDTLFLRNFTLPSQAYHITAKEFQNTIILASNPYDGSSPQIHAVQMDGTASTDFTLPSEISKINTVQDLYADKNHIYILGKVDIQNQQIQASIVKIISEPIASKNNTNNPSADAKKENNNQSLTLSIYPNPSQHEIFIETKELMNVKVTRLSGEVLIESQVSEGRKSIDISGLKPGTYLVQMNSGNKKYSSILIKN